VDRARGARPAGFVPPGDGYRARAVLRVHASVGRPARAPASRRPAVRLAACALLALASASAGEPATGSLAGRRTAGSLAAGRAAPAWPARSLVVESPNVSSQVLSGGYLFTSVSQTPRLRGPFLLERTSLETGVVRRGPRFSLDALAVAAGRVWLFPSCVRQPRLVEVDPRRLAVVRAVRLPTGSDPCAGVALATGPDGSVWIGSSRTLLRIDAATGATLAHITLPARLRTGQVAVDPSGRSLYVSAAHAADGGIAGAELFEYDAVSGRLLAHASRGPIAFSTAGAALTAVPGGVWASFNTGNLGVTIHLRQRDLALVAPPGLGVFTDGGRLFHWAMWGETVYGGGALWLANQGRFVACIDAQTGKVRASTRLPPSLEPDLLGVDAAAQRLYILDGSGQPRHVVELTPPRRCRR